MIKKKQATKTPKKVVRSAAESAPVIPPGIIDLHEASSRSILAAYGLTEEHIGLVAYRRDAVAPVFPALLDGFYAKVGSQRETQVILDKFSTVERQRPVLERYLRTLFGGRIDADFVQHRKTVGRIHDRIELPASYFVTMYTVVEAHLLGAGEKHANLKGEALEKYRDAVSRLLRFDMALVLSFFDEARRQRIAEVVQGRLNPIDRIMAVVEFQVDGTILSANENFLKVMGYSLDEIKGKHHRLFVDPAYAASAEYGVFWESLNRGQPHAGEFRRQAKGGADIWIQASYNPVFDESGKVIRVVKFATDVTQMKIRSSDFESQVTAINKAMAVIELGLDGTVLRANENFTRLVGYSLDEIKGRHHRMFVDAATADSAEYSEFWRNLREGRYQPGDFRRIGKGGKQVWMRATYNPILDLNGKVVKILKLAADVTEAKEAQAKQEALAKEIELNAQAADRFLEEAGSVLERIAARDLATRVEGDHEGPYARLKTLLNSAVENLDAALYQVSSASIEVSTACNEITGASQALAQATSRGAGTIEEVTSNLQEMVSMATQNARNSQEARSLADAARGSADKGADNMAKLSQSIEKIKASSDETAKIIKTIDDIAFQTNLLALNAAVEAARAGDAGRGFAVVAEEVRNLAMRSAEAARMTAQMIEGSVKNAEQGVQYNREVLENLGEINTRVRRVGEVMQEIAAASEVQSQTVSQVNIAMDELSKLTQQNAATSEETASAAEELTGQSNGLIDMVSEFVLSASEPAADPPPRQKSVASASARRSVAPVRGRPRPPANRPAPPARPALRAPVPTSHANGAHGMHGSARSAAAAFPLDDDLLTKF
ncbi:MAG: methyl-accepting chemotaxis protein [Polyangiaceae bacterium]